MNISKFLQEDNGKPSATRFGLLVWVIGLLVVWATGSIHNIYFAQTPELLEIPTSAITLVGFLIGAKVVQKYEEQPGAGAADNTTPSPAAKGVTERSAQPAKA